MKPAKLCLCDRIPRLSNRTHVLVVQHPRERAHPIGTARFVELGLESSEVVVAHGLDASCALRALEGRRPVLLHPSATSRSLDELEDSERPDTLVVVDGTWPNARTLVRDNPALAALPQVHLAPAAPSRYRIRREPSAECVSTLEATLLALTTLEPELDAGPLLASFDAMIDDQIAARTIPRTDSPRRRKTSRAYVGVPVALGERFDDLVLLYTELSRRDLSGQRHLLRWSAARMRDGALFDAFVAPSAPFDRALVPPDAPELDAEGAIDQAELAARFRAFLPENAIVGAWNAGFLERATSILEARETFDLGAAFRALRGAGHGVLDRIAAAEGFEGTRVAIPGRAGLRLGHAVALAERMRDEARRRGDARLRKADGPGAS